MFELFYMGGPLFMGIISLIGVAMLAVAAYNGLQVLKSQTTDATYRKIRYVREIGLFALVVGMLGTLIGLYSAFVYIEQEGGVSSGMMAGGLKVAMITTLYGMVIFIISYLIWLGLSWKLKQPN